MRNQYLSRPDVKDYLRTIPDITKEEKASLLNWLKEGNSPYSNDCYASDRNGHPLDYINAMRAEQEAIKEEWINRSKNAQHEANSNKIWSELPF